MQYRSSPTKVELKALYYVIEGTIYQSPDLGYLLNSRIQTSLWYLQKALYQVDDLVEYDADKGYVLPAIDASVSKEWGEFSIGIDGLISNSMKFQKQVQVDNVPEKLDVPAVEVPRKESKDGIVKKRKRESGKSF